MYLLFMEVGLSLVFLLSGENARNILQSWLLADANQVWREFKVWTLLTSTLFEIDFISLVFHGLILWSFLPTLENWWGTKKFLLFALWTSLAGTLVGTLVGLAIGSPDPVNGLDPFIFASIVAFGVLFAKQPVQFFGVLPLTGKQLTIGIIGFVTVFILIGQQWVVGAAYAASMLLAWLMVSKKWSPQLAWLRFKQGRAKRHLRVIRGGSRGKRDGDTWLN